MKVISRFRAQLLRERFVPLIVLISLILRWVLVFQGGEYYFPDEQRYQTSRDAAELLIHGKLNAALYQLFITPEHLGFKVLGIIPALVEHITGASLVVPALFFSLFSVLNLYLIFLLAQRLGASPRESLLALLLAAITQCLFFYTRHLMPYDTAMSFGLLSLYIGLSDRWDAKISLVCGFFGLLCFITYNGYWILTGLAMFVHVVRNFGTFANVFRKIIYLGIGLAAPSLVLILLAQLPGVDLVSAYRSFAGTIKEGVYSEGWSLPFAYFWSTEHFLFIALVLLAILGIVIWLREKTEGPLLWASCILFVYLCLVVSSVFLHAFVVYGRLARQMMPFLILLAAGGLLRLSQISSLGDKIARFTVALMVLQGLWNFYVVYRVSYPRDFVKTVQARYPDFNFSTKRFAFGAPEICENNGYAIQNIKYFLDAPITSLTVPGKVLLSASNPINFPPYLYEGYTPDQRRGFRDAKLFMIFYKLDPGLGIKDLRKLGIKSCLET